MGPRPGTATFPRRVSPHAPPAPPHHRGAFLARLAPTTPCREEGPEGGKASVPPKVEVWGEGTAPASGVLWGALPRDVAESPPPPNLMSLFHTNLSFNQINRFQAVSSPRTGCSCGVGSPWPVSGPDRVRAAAVLGHGLGGRGRAGTRPAGPRSPLAPPARPWSPASPAARNRARRVHPAKSASASAVRPPGAATSSKPCFRRKCPALSQAGVGALGQRIKIPGAPASASVSPRRLHFRYYCQVPLTLYFCPFIYYN